MNQHTVQDAIIEVDRISFSYRNEDATPGPRVLDDVSVSIRTGELVALIGRNGSGKTTLARHLNGLLKPDAGRVLIAGLDSRDAPVGQHARHVGYVFQNPDHQLFLPSVRREVEYGPQQLGLGGHELRERVDSVLERFQLAEIAEHHPAMLGRGLRRLTALAAVFAMGPRLLVLDEPTGGLDRLLTTRLMQMLQALVREGHAVVLITHEMRLVAEYAERVIALREGKIAADGPQQVLFGDEDALRTVGIEAPVVTQLARALGMPSDIIRLDQFCEAYRTLVAERVR